MKWTSIFLIMSAVLTCQGSPVSEWIPRSHRQASTITMKEGTAHVTGPKEAYVFSKKNYPVKTDQPCRLTGDFRSTTGGSLYLGLQFLDSRGTPIDGCQALVIPGTQTELVSEIKPGDRIVKLKDGSRWQKRNGSVIAFNAKTDLSDLPNRDLCRGAVTHIEKNGNIWEATTRLPFRKSYPRGCQVRQQAGAPYVYAVSGRPVKNEWQSFSYTFRKDQIYPGAASFRVVAFVFGQSPVLEIKNVKFELMGENR